MLAKKLKYLFLIGAATITSASANAQNTLQSYNLRASHSWKCAQVNGASYANGAVISQWDCVNQDNVEWYLLPLENGYYILRAKHSNKCAQVNGASYDDNAVISQWTCVVNGRTPEHSQWSLVSTDNNKFYIQSKHSKKCAQVNGSSNANGAVISQWDCVNRNNVKWYLTVAS
jgi:Ricin-type beta-trefoil lectin domain-like